MSAAIFRDSIATSLAFISVCFKRALAALFAKGPPDPIAKIPSSDSITSPVIPNAIRNQVECRLNEQRNAFTIVPFI